MGKKSTEKSFLDAVLQLVLFWNDLLCQTPLPHDRVFLEAIWNKLEQEATRLLWLLLPKWMLLSGWAGSTDSLQERLWAGSCWGTEAAGFSNHLVQFDCRPQAEWPSFSRAVSLHLCLQTSLLNISRDSQKHQWCDCLRIIFGRTTVIVCHQKALRSYEQGTPEMNDTSHLLRVREVTQIQASAGTEKYTTYWRERKKILL